MKLILHNQQETHLYEPQNVYCFARTYAEHAVELKNPIPAEPVLFLKSNQSLRELEGGPVSFANEVFHYEAEVVVLIGMPVKLGERCGWEFIAGVGLGIDLTRRGVQSQLKTSGLPWAIAKSFAGSAIVSKFLPPTSFPDPDKISFRFFLDGELRQSACVDQMTFSIPALLTWLARYQPLVAGDLIFTGTPSGVGEIRCGQRFTLELPIVGQSFDGVL